MCTQRVLAGFAALLLLLAGGHFLLEATEAGFVQHFGVHLSYRKGFNMFTALGSEPGELVTTVRTTTEAPIELLPPSSEPYKFAQPLSDMHRSQFAQDRSLEPLLSPIKNGFFVESGAFDGESISNTVYLESLGWQGLLIEPSPNYKNIVQKHRKAWVFHGALSPDGTSQMLHFRFGGPLGFADPSAKTEVPAEPLWKLLKSIDPKRNTVDFWSLDVEGSECGVLKGTDFTKVAVGVMLIEMNKNAQNNLCIKEVMKAKGFKDIGKLAIDSVFVNETYFQNLGLAVPEKIKDMNGKPAF